MSKGYIAKVWRFESSSGTSTYETIKYSDGTTSCSCPGWCRRVAADGSRSCKHTRLVDMGAADMSCLSNHDYNASKSVKAPQPQPQPQPVKKARKPAVAAPTPGYVVTRKFAPEV